MNRAVVLDASVIVKWVVAETQSNLAAALIEQDEPFFYIPGHALAEVFEALLRKLRKGEIVKEQLLIATLSLPGSFVSVDVDQLVSDATRLASDLSLSMYDALYAALAITREATLVTDDRKLAAAMSEAGQAERVVLLSDIVGRGLAPAPTS